MENMLYATVTKISMKYLVVCNVYTEEGGIKLLSHIGLGRAAPVWDGSNEYPKHVLNDGLMLCHSFN